MVLWMFIWFGWIVVLGLIALSCCHVVMLSCCHSVALHLVVV
jgi:hypothetical protein